MQTTELLMHLAEIAGVFVGFGALISVRSEALRDREVMMIRMMVVFGIQVVVAALFPVVLGAFDVAGHVLWATSAGVFLILFWGAGILDRWDSERARVLAATSRQVRIRQEIPAVPLWLALTTSLVLILIGRFPDHEQALYVTAVALDLVLTAQLLLYLAYFQRFGQSASDGGPPAVGNADPLPPDREAEPNAEDQPLQRAIDSPTP